MCLRNELLDREHEIKRLYNDMRENGTAYISELNKHNTVLNQVSQFRKGKNN